MYKYLFIMLYLAFACKRTNPCMEVNPVNYYLDSVSLSKNPYYTERFDTLIYVSNKGDSMKLHCFKRSEVMVEGDFSMFSPDCGGWEALSRYQLKNFEYKTINNSYIQVAHTRRGFPGYTESGNDLLENVIRINFNWKYYYLGDSEVGNPNVSTFSEKITFNNITYTDVIWKYATDTTWGKIYFNKDFGIVHIDDKRNGKEWTLLHAE